MAYFLTNDRVHIAYDIVGPYEGQPIVLITGYSASRITWYPQVTTLTKEGYRVITYDRRNHGESDSVSYGMRISRHGQDLAELLTYLHVSKPILVGHSMGADVIWAYLSLYGDSQLKAIVTEDMIPKLFKDSDWPFGIFNLSQFQREQAADRLPNTKLMVQPLPDELRKIIGAQTVPFNYAFNRPLLLENMVQDWRDVVQQETIPHLVVAGKQSPLWLPEHAAVVADLAPFGESVIIDHAGHMPHLEQYTEFNRLLLKFLAKI